MCVRSGGSLFIVCTICFRFRRSSSPAGPLPVPFRAFLPLPPPPPPLFCSQTFAPLHLSHPHLFFIVSRCPPFSNVFVFPVSLHRRLPLIPSLCIFHAAFLQLVPYISITSSSSTFLYLPHLPLSPSNLPLHQAIYSPVAPITYLWSAFISSLKHSHSDPPALLLLPFDFASS